MPVDFLMKFSLPFMKFNNFNLLLQHHPLRHPTHTLSKIVFHKSSKTRISISGIFKTVVSYHRTRYVEHPKISKYFPEASMMEFIVNLF